MDPVLDEPQIALLCELVEASRRLPTDRREEFIAFHVTGADPRIPVRHGGFPGDHYWAHPQDLEVLRQADLITVTNANENLLIFFVNPRGFRHYEHIKRSTGAPVERVEGEVRRHLASEQFQQAYTVAYAKWAKAEALLWGADSADHLSAIGHHCREAMQDFATAVVERYQPTEVSTNPMNSDLGLSCMSQASAASRSVTSWRHW